MLRNAGIFNILLACVGGSGRHLGYTKTILGIIRGIFGEGLRTRLAQHNRKVNNQSQAHVEGVGDLCRAFRTMGLNTVTGITKSATTEALHRSKKGV